MPKWSLSINHLAYADDIIILCSAWAATLQLLMGLLAEYEKELGQKISKEKSLIYLYEYVLMEMVITVEILTRICRKAFPFAYLGCPIFYSLKRKAYYDG